MIIITNIVLYITILKLKAAGVTGKVLAWFNSYLSGRTQRVILPGIASDWVYIRAGVPQGSILGPLLFLLFINDIVLDIESNTRLFADDTCLYIIVDDPVTAANCLNADLEKNQNGLTLGLFLSIQPKQRASSFLVN